jgi:hypothetical protein
MRTEKDHIVWQSKKIFHHRVTEGTEKTFVVLTTPQAQLQSKTLCPL